MPLILEVHGTGGVERAVPVGDAALTIGRSSTADVVVADPLLSRHHARVFPGKDGAVLVEDLGSRNGTFLNGETLRQPTPFRPGDRVTLGGTILELRRADSSKIRIAESGLSDGTILRPASELLAGSGAIRPEDSGSPRLLRYAERLRALNDLHKEVAGEIAAPEIAERVVARAVDLLGAEQGALLVSADGGYRPLAEKSTRGDEIRVSKSVAAEVVDRGMAALVLDTEMDARFASAESLMLAGIRSLVAAPVSTRGSGTDGMLLLSSRLGVRRFDDDDLELLVSIASVGSLALRNRALADEAAQRRRLEEELALARRIQRTLLPDSVPQVAGWELVGRNVPSRGVSGDYFEVRQRKDGAIVLLIADVSGKGIAAALLTASLQALSEAPLEDSLPPDEVCARLSRGIFKRTPPEKYATMFLAIVDPATGELAYSNAGHTPGLIRRVDGNVDHLPTSGLPIGLFEPASWKAGTATLAPGDSVVLYTDGFTEAEDADGTELGVPRLAELLGRSAAGAAEEIADALEHGVDAFVGPAGYGDDRTIVVARRLG